MTVVVKHSNRAFRCSISWISIIYRQFQGQSTNAKTDAQTRSQSLEQTPKRPVNDRNVTATLPRLVRTHIPLYQVVVPIEAHGCRSTLCLLWLRLWAAGAHVGLSKWWDGLSISHPTTLKAQHGLSSLCTSRSSCQASLAPPVAEAETPCKKSTGTQHLVKQMAVHEVGLCIQAILDKPLPMHWMHDLSIQMLGELLRLHPAIVTSEFGKVGMAQFCLPQKLNTPKIEWVRQKSD